MFENTETKLEFLITNKEDWRFIAKTAYKVIKTFGYLSKNKSVETDDTPSADYVTEALYSKSTTQEFKNFMNKINTVDINDIDFDKLFDLEDILVQNKENPSKFEYNVITIMEKMRRNIVNIKEIGFITFFVFRFFFYKDDYTKVEFNHGNFSKGDKIENVEVTMVNCHTFQGHYGTTNIYTFVTESNTRFKWFTSTNQMLDNDQKVIIKRASVKDFEDNTKWGKSVIITRAKLEEI